MKRIRLSKPLHFLVEDAMALARVSGAIEAVMDRFRKNVGEVPTLHGDHFTQLGREFLHTYNTMIRGELDAARKRNDESSSEEIDIEPPPEPAA